MATIIAGHFEQQARAQQTVDELRLAGFPADKISLFYVNPPGQHATYPIGGDHDKSAGAEESGKGMAAGAATGGAIGAAIGLASAPVTGPLGPAAGALVGAHAGSLVGSLSQMKEDGKAADENPVPVRSAGMLVAVSLSDAALEGRAINVLRMMGAKQVERAEGTIADGDWQDFNPAQAPTLVPSAQSRQDDKA